MKVFYRNHIELIKLKQIKKNSIEVKKMLQRGGTEKWISGANLSKSL